MKEKNLENKHTTYTHMQQLMSELVKEASNERVKNNNRDDDDRFFFSFLNNENWESLDSFSLLQVTLPFSDYVISEQPLWKIRPCQAAKLRSYQYTDSTDFPFKWDANNEDMLLVSKLLPSHSRANASRWVVCDLRYLLKTTRTFLWITVTWRAL